MSTNKKEMGSSNPYSLALAIFLGSIDHRVPTCLIEFFTKDRYVTTRVLKMVHFNYYYLDIRPGTKMS